MSVRNFLIGVGVVTTVIVTGVTLFDLATLTFAPSVKTLFCTDSERTVVINLTNSREAILYDGTAMTIRGDFAGEGFTCLNILGEGWEDVFEK